jgi:hypothetical protein
VSEGPEDENPVETTVYSYLQVRVIGAPTFGKCMEAILKAYKNELGDSLYQAKDINSTKDIADLISDINTNVQVDFGMIEEISELQKAKNAKVRKLEDYDTSANVNSFYLGRQPAWLPKDTRVGLMNSISIGKAAGKENSTLWFGGVCITVECDAAINMLSLLELYALDCYNKTAEHRSAILNLDSVEAVEAYDFTEGYPEKLRFMK